MDRFVMAMVFHFRHGVASGRYPLKGLCTMAEMYSRRARDRIDLPQEHGRRAVGPKGAL